MQLEILDVGHGAAAYVIADSGNLVLVDCGHRANPEFRPSLYLHGKGQRSTERLFITNYDQDHISDLPTVRRLLPVRLLHRNQSITADQLRTLKLRDGPITDAMDSMLDMIVTYTAGETATPAFPGIRHETFAARFGEHFVDTNNLSLVIFLQCHSTRFVFPGDLEEAGWLHHLRDASFRSWLAGVNVFVASHHGRESGYCPDVFRYCSPNLVVFSDSEIIHTTQEMSSTYAQHASGITFNGQFRRVLSTRSDGSILWRF